MQLGTSLKKQCGSETSAEQRGQADEHARKEEPRMEGDDDLMLTPRNGHSRQGVIQGEDGTSRAVLGVRLPPGKVG